MNDYGHYATPQLIEAFRHGPERIRTALQGLSEDELRARPRGPNTWSAQEITMHLTDSELIGAVRIRKAWAETGVAWPGYDQDAWTPILNHQAAGAEGREMALELFGSLRKTTLTVFERAEPADWAGRWGMHPEYGRMTLRNLLELYADHSERHVEQVLEIRARLGRPLGLPLLLTDRLY